MSDAQQDTAASIESLLAAAPAELQLETQLLIARTLGWNRAKVLAFAETRIEADALLALKGELARLQSGEPFAYLVGTREFYGLEFTVNPHVLVPRADTELLVELAIERAPQRAHVVDLGTGSGAIAVSLKHSRPDLSVTATDRSPEALEVARQNAARHNCDIGFRLSSWFESLPGTFDLILSNPPYIRPDDPHLPSLAHEPQSALVAEENGMADIIAIAVGATNALRPGGQLLVEHGFDQQQEVTAAFQRCGFAKITTHQDLAGLPRVTSGSLS